MHVHMPSITPFLLFLYHTYMHIHIHIYTQAHLLHVFFCLVSEAPLAHVLRIPLVLLLEPKELLALVGSLNTTHKEKGMHTQRDAQFNNT
jgi:hypothetical protein